MSQQSTRQHCLRNLYALLMCFTFVLPVFSQSNNCSADILRFTSQAEVDSFGSCTVFEGDIAIEGPDITNLSGLNSLVEITGDLFIRPTATSLQSLEGLNNLTTLGGLDIRGSQNRLTTHHK